MYRPASETETEGEGASAALLSHRRPTDARESEQQRGKDASSCATYGRNSDGLCVQAQVLALHLRRHLLSLHALRLAVEERCIEGQRHAL
jgi:hypothetical protein